MGESPFADAAIYYDRFRPPYAAAALDHLIHALKLDATTRVLDLGCGPGTIAIPLSRVVAEVVAVDLDAAMLGEAARLAAEQGRTNIRWIQARAEDVGLELGAFRAITFGQSLHWMDRDRVLEMAVDLVEDGGGLAILDEGRNAPPESWMGVAARVVRTYLGPSGRHPLKHPESDHEPSLQRSSHFQTFTVQEFPYEIVRDVASVLGCVYSGVNATRPMFGDRAEAFEADLTAALLSRNRSGVFRESLATAVFVALKRA